MMAAIQQYKIHPLRAIIHEATGLNGVLAILELDERFLHNHSSDAGSDCGRLLCSTPATHWYKERLCHIKLRKSLTLVRVVFINTLAIPQLDGRFLHNHCSDPYSDSTRLMGRRQIPSGIKDISVASRLMQSLTLVGVVFIGNLAIPELDGVFLYNHCSDPESDSGRLLGSMPAMQQYKGRLCRIKTDEIASCGGCL